MYTKTSRLGNIVIEGLNEPDTIDLGTVILKETTVLRSLRLRNNNTRYPLQVHLGTNLTKKQIRFQLLEDNENVFTLGLIEKRNQTVTEDPSKFQYIQTQDDRQDHIYNEFAIINSVIIPPGSSIEILILFKPVVYLDKVEEDGVMEEYAGADCIKGMISLFEKILSGTTIGSKAVSQTVYQLKFKATVCPSIFTVETRSIFTECSVRDLEVRDILIANRCDIEVHVMIEASKRSTGTKVPKGLLRIVDPKVDQTVKSIIIPPFSTTTLRAFFQSSEKGIYHIDITLRNAANTANFHVIPFSACVNEKRLEKKPLVEVDTKGITFDECYLGSINKSSFTIKNIYTDGPIRLKISSNAPSGDAVFHLRPLKQVPAAAMIKDEYSESESSAEGLKLAKFRDRGEATAKVILEAGESIFVSILYRPSRQKGLSDSKATKLSKRTFSVSLIARVTSSENLTDSKSIPVSARVCLSLIKLGAEEINLGDCNIGSLTTVSVNIENCSDLSAHITIRFHSKVIRFRSQNLIIPAQQTIEIPMDYIPRKINPEYQKQVTFANKNNPDNDQFLRIIANNVDENRVTLHSHFYRIQTYQSRSYLDFGTVVLNSVEAKTLTISNVSGHPLSLRFACSVPSLLQLYQRQDIEMPATQNIGPNTNTNAASKTVSRANSTSSMDAPPDLEEVRILNAAAPLPLQEEGAQLPRPNRQAYLDLAVRSESSLSTQVVQARFNALKGNEEGNIAIKSSGCRLDECLAKMAYYDNQNSELSSDQPTVPRVDPNKTMSKSEMATLKMEFFNTIKDCIADGTLTPVTNISFGERSNTIASQSTPEIKLFALFTPTREKYPTVKSKRRKIHASLLIEMLSFDRTLYKEVLGEAEAEGPVPIRELVLVAKVCRSSMTLTQKNFNFGTIPTLKKVSRNIVINNTGEVPLLYSISIGKNIASMSLQINDPLGTVKPYSTKEIVFTFEPKIAEKYKYEIIIHNIQDESDSKVVTVKANVISPKRIFIKSLDLDFGLCLINSCSELRSVTITNTSEKRRTFRISANEALAALADAEKQKEKVEAPPSTETKCDDDAKKNLSTDPKAILLFRMEEVPLLDPSTEAEINKMEIQIRLAKKKGDKEKIATLMQEIEKLVLGETSRTVSSSAVFDFQKESITFVLDPLQTRKISVLLLNKLSEEEIGKYISAGTVQKTQSGSLAVYEVKNRDSTKTISFHAEVCFSASLYNRKMVAAGLSNVEVIPLDSQDIKFLTDERMERDNSASFPLESPLITLFSIPKRTIHLGKVPLSQKILSKFTITNERVRAIVLMMVFQNDSTDKPNTEEANVPQIPSSDNSSSMSIRCVSMSVGRSTMIPPKNLTFSIPPRATIEITVELLPKLPGKQKRCIMILPVQPKFGLAPQERKDLVWFIVDACPPEYVKFPQVKGGEKQNLDMGICYYDDSLPYSLKYPFKIENIHTNPIFVTVDSNLGKQIVVYSDETCENVAKDVMIYPNCASVFHICLQPTMAANSSSRSLVGGLRVHGYQLGSEEVQEKGATDEATSSWQTSEPKGVALHKQELFSETIKFSVLVGRSKWNVSPTNIELSKPWSYVAEENCIFTNIVVKNLSELPFRFHLRLPPDNVITTYSEHHIILDRQIWEMEGRQSTHEAGDSGSNKKDQHLSIPLKIQPSKPGLFQAEIVIESRVVTKDQKVIPIIIFMPESHLVLSDWVSHRSTIEVDQNKSIPVIDCGVVFLSSCAASSSSASTPNLPSQADMDSDSEQIIAELVDPSAFVDLTLKSIANDPISVRPCLYGSFAHAQWDASQTLEISTPMDEIALNLSQSFGDAQALARPCSWQQQNVKLYKDNVSSILERRSLNQIGAATEIKNNELRKVSIFCNSLLLVPKNLLTGRSYKFRRLLVINEDKQNEETAALVFALKGEFCIPSVIISPERADFGIVATSTKPTKISVPFKITNDCACGFDLEVFPSVAALGISYNQNPGESRAGTATVTTVSSANLMAQSRLGERLSLPPFGTVNMLGSLRLQKLHLQPGDHRHKIIFRNARVLGKDLVFRVQFKLLKSLLTFSHITPGIEPMRLHLPEIHIPSAGPKSVSDNWLSVTSVFSETLKVETSVSLNSVLQDLLAVNVLLRSNNVKCDEFQILKNETVALRIRAKPITKVAVPWSVFSALKSLGGSGCASTPEEEKIETEGTAAQDTTQQRRWVGKLGTLYFKPTLHFRVEEVELYGSIVPGETFSVTPERLHMSLNKVFETPNSVTAADIGIHKLIQDENVEGGLEDINTEISKEVEIRNLQPAPIMIKISFPNDPLLNLRIEPTVAEILPHESIICHFILNPASQLLRENTRTGIVTIEDTKYASVIKTVTVVVSSVSRSVPTGGRKSADLMLAPTRENVVELPALTSPEQKIPTLQPTLSSTHCKVFCKLEGCHSISDTHQRYEINLGQYNVNDSEIHWPLSLVHVGPDSKPLEYRIYPVCGQAWLSCNRSGGILKVVGDRHNIILKCDTKVPAEYIGHIVVENIQQPSDMKYICVSVQVIGNEKESFDVKIEGWVCGDKSAPYIDYGTVIYGKRYPHRSLRIYNHAERQLDFWLNNSLDYRDKTEVNFSFSRRSDRYARFVTIPAKTYTRLFLHFLPQQNPLEEWNTKAASLDEKQIQIIISCKQISGLQFTFGLKASCIVPTLQLSHKHINFYGDIICNSSGTYEIVQTGASEMSPLDLAHEKSKREEYALEENSARSISVIESNELKLKKESAKSFSVTVTLTAYNNKQIIDNMSANIGHKVRYAIVNDTSLFSIIGQLKGSLEPGENISFEVSIPHSSLEIFRKILLKDKYLEEHIRVYNVDEVNEKYLVYLRFSAGCSKFFYYAPSPRYSRIETELENKIFNFFTDFSVFWGDVKDIVNKSKKPSVGWISKAVALITEQNLDHELYFRFCNLAHELIFFGLQPNVGLFAFHLADLLFGCLSQHELFLTIVSSEPGKVSEESAQSAGNGTNSVKTFAVMRITSPEPANAIRNSFVSKWILTVKEFLIYFAHLPRYQQLVGLIFKEEGFYESF